MKLLTCVAIEVRGPVDGLWTVVLAGSGCTDEILSRFVGAPVVLLFEAVSRLLN